MLPKKHRIQRKDFDTYFRSARPLHTQSLTLRVGTIASDAPTQCACVVSKKVSKISPTRHLIKRRVYSILREYLNQIPPSVIIVHIKRGGDFSFDNLKKEIDEVMKQVFG
ncbi:ribonuclease P protein component [Candidatus Nomurabacteria bacterium]|nr:ribonuclease P protein component [Candidatus Nomurabacteria bacterium]